MAPWPLLFPAPPLLLALTGRGPRHWPAARPSSAYAPMDTLHFATLVIDDSPSQLQWFLLPSIIGTLAFRSTSSTKWHINVAIPKMKVILERLAHEVVPPVMTAQSFGVTH
ncbi:uncharacterized protein LOC123412698 [Hordeum vulgare subsp. vulgare]|uniref:uncharacterized protein LOC123412698 n=1 Tax=Hordeum vulgare subsp. vulgare TaxID=112509 RepID=UPI001D1A4FCC|nr:uncharacterized protein LOC123412698 [Hordeum vulgare subsp. vulgare]